MPCLADRIRRCSRIDGHAGLVGTDRVISLDDALRCRESAKLAARYAGKVVVLAIADQLRAALALMALDGVAKRMVLVPEGEDAAHRSAICRASSAEHVIEDWPLPSDRHAEERAAQPLPGCVTEWVLLTSGTTGVPKLVVHTLHTLAGHIAAGHIAAGHIAAGHIAGGHEPPTHRVWCTFYDTRRYGGLQVLLRSLIQNDRLILSRPDMPVRDFLAHAAAHGATHVVGTPSHYRQIFISGAIALLSPSYLRLSGEIADQAILNRLAACFPHAKLVHAFASTEAGLAFEVADGQAGLPADFGAVAITGVQAEIRTHGLHIRSPFNAVSYLNGGVRTQVAEADGFIDTGDLLERHGDRYRFSGRRAGEVNIGGRKVHPEEVEATLYEHAAVELCAVWARHSPITGAIVAADIVCAPGLQSAFDCDATSRSALVQDIQRFCRSRLAPYKVPASISFVANLTVNRSGKLSRQHA